jgi:hypothetical protein
VALRDQFTPGYRAMLADLGIVAYNNLIQRSEAVRSPLTSLWTTAEAIMEAPPAPADPQT